MYSTSPTYAISFCRVSVLHAYQRFTLISGPHLSVLHSRQRLVSEAASGLHDEVKPLCWAAA